MNRWIDNLNSAWSDLALVAPASRQFRTKAVSAETTLDVRAGLRASDDAPCLLLQCNVAPSSLFELGGMRLSLVSDEQARILVLSLEDSNRRDLFLTICADIIAAASSSDRKLAMAQFLSRLDAWRQFLRDRRGGMAGHEVVGLLGELVVLKKLLEKNFECLDEWKSPIGGLHDFLRQGRAIEVKTSLGPSSFISIANLDQLDTIGLDLLFLIHVRLVESSGGQSLGEIIADLTAFLPEESRTNFENMLLRRGLSPSDLAALASPLVELRSIEAFRVSEGFPRLQRASLPVALIEATYSLDLRGISTFREDLEPTFDVYCCGARQ